MLYLFLMGAPVWISLKFHPQLKLKTSYPNTVTSRHRVMWGLSTIIKEKNKLPWRFGKVNIKFTFCILGHSQVSVLLLSLPDGEENRVSQQMPVLALSLGCAAFRKRGSESTHKCAEIAI